MEFLIVRKSKLIEPLKSIIKNQLIKYKKEIWGEYLKNYYNDNKNKLEQQRKKYRENNKDKISEYKKKYMREYNKQYFKSSLDIILNQKIKNHIKADIKYNRHYNEDDYITIEYAKEMLIKCNNKCSLCNIELKLTNFEFQDKQQFSIDRIDNKLAHIKTNCQITCCHCNHKKS
jgi:hypothetical protein